MKKIFYSLLFVIGAALLINASFFALPQKTVASLLTHQDEPKNADVIIALSGDFERLYTVADLIEKGYADKVILTNGEDGSFNENLAVQAGIPEEAIIMENQAVSTHENAVYSKEIMRERDFDSALVVTSDYHMKRTKIQFDDVMSNTGITLDYIPHVHAKEAWGPKHVQLWKEFYKLTGTIGIESWDRMS